MCHGQTYECVRLTHKTHRRTFSHAQCLRLNGSTELYEILQDDYNHSHLCFLQVSIINHPLTQGVSSRFAETRLAETRFAEIRVRGQGLGFTVKVRGWG